MAVSIRARSIYKILHPLLEETDIARQETVRMPVPSIDPRTEQLAPLAFYRIENEQYALMKIVRALEKWSEDGNTMPPAHIGMSYGNVAAYWQVLRMSIYFCRGQEIALLCMDIPDNLVYCSARTRK